MHTDPIDAAIHHVEQLFRTVAGRELQPAEVPYAPIPPEKDPQAYVEEQMQRLSRLLGTLGGATQTRAQPWVPTATLWFGPQELVVCVDLPGVKARDVNVVIVHNAVHVSGERPEPADNGAPRLTRAWAESGTGPFTRVIPLPPGANTEEPVAKLADGVLELRFPRLTAAQIGKPVLVS